MDISMVNTLVIVDDREQITIVFKLEALYDLSVGKVVAKVKVMHVSTESGRYSSDFHKKNS